MTLKEKPQASITRRGMVVRALLQPIVLLPFLGALLFIPAGGIDWPMGWAVLGAYLTGLCLFNLLVILHDPELANERVNPPAGTKKWDRTLTNLANLPILLILPVAGLDRRYDWSPPLALPVQVAALVGLLLALVLVAWAMMTNRFFSSVVRIQADRGHTVVSNGPYRFVRHPGYLGMMAMVLSATLALGSLWGLICGVLAGGLYIARTALEDRTLREELPGYAQYTRKVRYRLVPWVW
jgi:protein-S-isoprenylcysteine O-methyltransferase Ste14